MTLDDAVQEVKRRGTGGIRRDEWPFGVFLRLEPSGAFVRYNRTEVDSSEFSNPRGVLCAGDKDAEDWELHS